MFPPPCVDMEPATANGSRSGSNSGPIAGDTRGWSRLPEDLLVSVLRELHVVDAARSGAVCTTWNAAYAAFRRFRIPSPKQPPCLLYASDALVPGADAAALHCPSTGATLQIPFPLGPLARRPLLGSGHGWLVTADEASNLHLLNPVTGAQVALPPITAIHHVESGTDEDGDPAYLVYENRQIFNYSEGRFEVNTKPSILKMNDAYECMYFRVVLSASPSAGRACVVLLLHMPQGEVSFARLGDDRWTWVAPGDDTGLPLSWYGYRDAMYSATDGLFYLFRLEASMFSLDLNGPSPKARMILDWVPKSVDWMKYLVQTPAGDILQVWRFTEDSEIPVEYPRDYEVDDTIGGQDPSFERNTIEMKLYKVDLHGHRVELIKSLPKYALFLGYNGSMCIPVKDFPGLKPNCVYITDDSMEYVNFCKHNRRDLGIWSLAEQSMSKLVDVSQIIYPWLNWPSPIWIKPSFF